MDPFNQHTGKVVFLSEDNVDTDRIIPARYLSRISKLGYGELVFADVRGEKFPLDQSEAQGASILVVGTNFGCGSSREHAVWALQQAGFKAIIARATPTAPAYSDIFRQNSANCGLLLIELPEGEHDRVRALSAGAQVTIDLPAQTINFGGESIRFDINEVNKDALIKGLDLIGTTLQMEDEIARYEREQLRFVPSR